MAKKSLGQHFLSAPGVVNDIIKAADLKKNEVVLEIGPGKGVLTEKLLQTGTKVIAIEKDDWLTKDLEEKFNKEIQTKQLILKNEDFLKSEISEIENVKYKIVANIPYNITGLILRNIFSRKNQPQKVVLMVQKEVADRIIARDKKESMLGISIKAYGTPKIIRKVLPGSFNPPPKINSAVLAIENISRDVFSKITEEKFFRVAKLGFGEKRKQLKNNLKVFQNVVQVLDICDISKNIRAEDITIEDWVCLTEKLKK